MRIGYISDLHLDIGGYEQLKLVDFSHYRDTDVLVVAGDVHNDSHMTAVFLAQLKDATGKEIIFVPGNHEHYMKPIETGEKIFEDCGVKVLHRYSPPVIIDDVLFVGDTLWTDFDIYGKEERYVQMEGASTRMNDYFRIWVDFFGGQKLTPYIARDYCIEAVLSFERNIRAYTKTHNIRKIVVVSHHGPSYESVDEAYRVPQYSMLNGAYASGILDKDNPSYSAYLANSVDLWIHGHTHCTLDYDIGRVRVVTNPRGYTLNSDENENSRFDWYKSVEL